MKTYIIDYLYRGQVRTKYIEARSIALAVKKARLKNSSILNIDIKEYQVPDPYLLRDF